MLSELAFRSRQNKSEELPAHGNTSEPFLCSYRPYIQPIYSSSMTRFCSGFKRSAPSCTDAVNGQQAVCSHSVKKCKESEIEMSEGPTNANGEITRKELQADKRRVAGGTIYRDLLWDNDGDVKEVVDALLDLIPDLEEREQQLTVKRAIKKLNGVSIRNSRLLNFRDAGD